VNDGSAWLRGIRTNERSHFPLGLQRPASSEQAALFAMQQTSDRSALIDVA
jgi:hypothetical protein